MRAGGHIVVYMREKSEKHIFKHHPIPQNIQIQKELPVNNRPSDYSEILAGLMARLGEPKATQRIIDL